MALKAAMEKAAVAQQALQEQSCDNSRMSLSEAVQGYPTWSQFFGGAAATEVLEIPETEVLEIPASQPRHEDAQPRGVATETVQDTLIVPGREY